MGYNLKSDGLGGFSGVSSTLGLGAKKRITRNKFHLYLITVLFSLLHTNDSGTLFSLILALQRSNEIYRSIKLPYSRIKCFQSKNQSFSLNCICMLILAVLSSWLLFLILQSGDIEVNPGPGSVDGSADSSLNVSFNAAEMLSNHLSILHLNIQSIAPKMDLIKCEADAYDVLVFSESWLKPETRDENITIENFLPPFRADRCDRPGGGVVVYVRDSFFCKRRSDLELQGLEAVWVEIRVKSRNILIGGFYRPPNSNTGYFELINESIDRAYNTNIVDIIILGDFNFNMSVNNKNKMTELLQEFNLKQLITEPTHFTENSSSLIDLILVRNNSNILSSGVIDPFIPDQTRYHCPIIVLLKFLRPSTKTFKRRIWNYKMADFDKYRVVLSEYNLLGRLEQTNNIDENAQHITEALLLAAESTIPNKTVTIRLLHTLGSPRI